MMKKAPWGTRLAWYYYNNPEFFEKNDDDFDKDAREHAENGIHIVQLFSMTHFRWSFYPYWDRINDTLRRICTAFHRYGIRVVEHHSTSLCECPLRLEDWDDREGGIFRERGLYFTSDKKRYGPYLERWSKIKPFLCNPDATVDGISFASMIQIDGRTGQRSVSNYQTSVMCYNNENFRRIYFDYLESLYKCGIDGIMTDDVQYFSNGNACACPTCRRLFKQQTGYDLPAPDEWRVGFMDNYSNPAFVAFNKFKIDNTARFQRDVDKHFHTLGYDMLRIDYFGSSLASTNKTSYPFHRCASSKDLIFQENTRFNVTKLSWPAYYCSAAYLYELGKQNNIPSMSVFYDAKEDAIYFGWAMAMAWGQMFNGSFPYTPETKKVKRFLYDFEQHYPRVVYDLKKQADVGIFYSADQRDIWHDDHMDVIGSVSAWLQAGLFSGFCMRIVTQETVEVEMKPAEVKVLIIPNILMLKDSELLALGVYVRAGGHLVLCGQCGTYDENLCSRSPERIKELLFSDVSIKPLAESISYSLPGISPMPFNTIYEGGEVLCLSQAGAVHVREKAGAGEITFIGLAAGKMPWVKTARGNRPTAIATSIDAEQLLRPNLAPGYSADILRATLGRYLKNMVAEPLFRINQPDEYLVTLFDSADDACRVLHLVNIKDTLQAEATPYAFETTIHNFDFFNERGSKPTKNDSLHLDVACRHEPAAVRLLTPERSEPLMVPFNYDGRLHINIPPDIFSGYAAIEINLRHNE